MVEILVDPDWKLTLKDDRANVGIRFGLIVAKQRQLERLKSKSGLPAKTVYLIDTTISELSWLRGSIASNESASNYDRITYLLHQIEKEL